MILSPFLDAGGVTLYAGDCIEVMRQLPEASVDAIVTDPPYGLEFMGKDWDSFAPAGDRPKRSGWTTENTGAQINNADKSTPHGRTGVAFGQRRKTYKCSACGRRDAFRNDHGCGDKWEHEWVDALPVQALAFQAFSEAWAREAYRVLKPGGHLLAFAGTRTYHRMASGVEDAGFEIRDCIAWMYGSGFPKSLDVSKAIDKAAGAEREVVGERKQRGRPDGVAPFNTASAPTEVLTAPATDAARKWSGWGTALKPAFEPVVVARKPLVGTVAQNVLEHGTGAINVDGCRIGTIVETWPSSRSYAPGQMQPGGIGETQSTGNAPPGRWPANVTLDETAAAMLDEQSGERAAGANPSKRGLGSATVYGEANRSGVTHDRIQLDAGGASRFFYTAKASKKDRNTNGANNTHPTVKPTTLMRWLIRLVTPPGGVILDPFGGSGSTGVAARAEGVRCILIEREPEYLDIIRQRLDDGDLFSAIG